MDSAQKSLPDSAKALLKIVHGDVDDLKVPHKSIVTGKKIKNDILRQFVETFLEHKPNKQDDLIQTLLFFDEAIEKEFLTEDMLDEIRKDPSILEKYLD